MTIPPTSESEQLVPPAESTLLKAMHRKSGLTVADLSAATGLSVATIHIALNGIRYRSDGPRIAVPTDITLVKLGSPLGMDPQVLRMIGRDRAADMLEEAKLAGPRVGVPSEQEAVAAAAARAALAVKVLSAFSSDEMMAEIRRRKMSDE